MVDARAAAVDPGLRVLTREPYNAETRLDRLDGVLTPVGRHFVRNHFALPEHPGTLTIDGAVLHPLTLSATELAARPSVTRQVTLECAGNGRALLDPMPPGEPWRLGAVGTAEWTGVPLADLLAEAGLAAGGGRDPLPGRRSRDPARARSEIAFERSLPPDVAQGALVAFAMNGEPLTPNHGAPLRLIVPGWYGMASVKWLTGIRVAGQPFRGHFQADRYVVDGRPLGLIAPRAVVVSPADGARVRLGPNVIRGLAWSGRGLARVEVSTDAGVTWRPARLGPQLADEAWRTWQIGWAAGTPGPAVILARAVDGAGRTQPLAPVRNPLGYGNNASQPVRVEVAPGDR